MSEKFFRSFRILIVAIGVLGTSAATARTNEPLLPISRLKSKLPITVFRTRMLVTAYDTCSICTGKWSKYKKTATGRDARLPGVAADFSLLPPGIRVHIPGIGEKMVDDTGGGMRRNARRGIYHIDLRLSSHAKALAWGRQWLEVEILPPVK